VQPVQLAQAQQVRKVKQVQLDLLVKLVHKEHQ